MEQKRLGDYIDIAIQREIEAQEFYTGLMARVADEQAKDALKLLAAEEKKHQQFLQKYRDGGFPAEGLRMNNPIDYKIAEHMDKPDIGGSLESKDVYLIAAHRELNSYNFYMGLAQLHPAGALRDTFEKIASEELRHKEKVEYLYTNTAFPQTAGG
jgi:rubrerythrin